MFRQFIRGVAFHRRSLAIPTTSNRCASAMAQNNTEFQRLPKSIKPINYKLDFIPNFGDFSFTGKASVKLQVVEPTSKIVFNSRGLDISSAHFRDSQASIAYNEDQDLVTFTFPCGLNIGEGVLDLAFKGMLADDMQGMYRSKYKDANGKESDILTTQFESVYARRAFPCMDEPDRKATFNISMVALDNNVVLSNMPEVSREVIPTPTSCPAPPDGHNYVKVSFDESPCMSTYLLAMVVGDFEYISAKDTNGVEVRVYTPPGKKATGEFALDVAVKTLPFYATLFGHTFPLPKLDLIAIPDFACGAMENWGLITYRETMLLVETSNSSLLSKQHVALVVAHELAHMWFGNLVTMEWWTDLWLNEGFATWIEYLAVDHCFPEYDIWTLFVSREYTHALRLDELKNSHAIEIAVRSPNEVEEIFDAVSYQKGASVIRMLNEFLGAETFRAGLQHYITRHKYGNTVTMDLWKALTEVSGQPVEEIMSTWTKQMGYPVLSVRMVPSPDGASYNLGVKQRRFLGDGSCEEMPHSQWFVPLTVSRVDDPTAVISRTLLSVPKASAEGGSRHHDGAVFAKQETLVPLTGVANSSVIVNPGAVGFYRVQYDEALLPGILGALAQGKVPERDRLNLVDDQFALARAGDVSLVTVLDLCRAFTGETQYSVWSILRSGLEQVRSLLQETSYTHGNEVVFSPEPSPELRGLSALYSQMALPVYEKIGFDAKPTDSNNDCLLRPLIIALLGIAGNPDVLSKARAAFTRHFQAVSEAPEGHPPAQEMLISPDLRTSVYAMCMKNGGDREFDQLLVLHDKATMQDERVRLLSCLGSARSPALIQRLFSLAFSDYVRKQDRYHVLLGVTGTAAGRRALWNLVQAKIATLEDDLATTVMLSYVLKGSLSDFCTKDRYTEVKTFFEKHHVPCQRAIQQVLESVAINTARCNRDSSAISSFLKEISR